MLTDKTTQTYLMPLSNMITLTANESKTMQLDMNEKIHEGTQCDILKEDKQSFIEKPVGTESDRTNNDLDSFQQSYFKNETSEIDYSTNDCFLKDKYLVTIAAYFITEIFFRKCLTCS